MRDKFKLPKLANMLMLVMLLASVFAPTMYDASELTKEVISQASEVKEEEVLSEVDSESTSEETASEEVDSEKDSEENETLSNAPPKEVNSEEVVSEEIISEEAINDEATSEDTVSVDTESDVIDLTGMTKDEIAKYLDPNAEEMNFITLEPQALKDVRGVSLTEITSSEDFSVINNTMYGEWGIYKANGHFIFCIQPGADVLSSADTTSESGSVYKDFSTTTKRYVGRVISSAMDHYHSSSDTDWVFAGQLLIWQYLADHEADTIGNPMASWNPGYLDGFQVHNTSAYKTEMNKIEDELDVWTVKPSFMGTTTNPKKHTLTYNASNNNFSTTLKDTNGVWDDKFANYGDFGNYKVTNPAGADNVKITTSVESTSYTSAKSYTWTPYASGEEEFYDAGQDLLYVGSDPVKGAMKFNTETRPLGGIKAKKVDSETGEALAGAEFKIYEDPNNNDKIDSGEEVTDTVVSDSNGLMETGKVLLEGDYTAKESKAPSGYVKSNTVHSLHVNANEITDYSSKPWKNDIIRGGFSLTKLGEVYGLDPEALADVEFTVTSTSFPSFSKVYTTDSNGNIITSAGELKVGDYHISETKAPSKYVMNYEEDFSIKKDGVIVQLNDGKDIVNELYMNKVHGRKTAQNLDNNDDALYPLAEATFGIYQDIGDANGKFDEEDILVDTQVTDANGEFTSIELQEGSYYVMEIEAPTGYNLNEATYPFTVANDGTLNDGAVINLGDITNEVITGTADLTKVGSKECDKALAKPGEIKDCQTVLSDVSFAIYQDLNGDGEWGKGEDKPIQVITTNEDGGATTEALKYGTYFAKEINNPRDNYFMNNNVFTFNITNQDEVVHINNGVAIENIEKLGKIEITKTGDTIGNLNSDSVPLESAEYTIFDSEGKEVDVLTTDSEGHATSINLPFGEYTFKETVAPEGYVLDETTYEFTIDNDSYLDTISFALTDEVITNQIGISKVETGGSEELPGAEIEIKDKDGNVIVSWTSDEEEHIVDDVEFGEYEICETKAPVGHVLATECIPFEVTEDGVVQHFTLENDLLTSDIQLTKVDSKTGEHLKGAEFELLKKDETDEFVNYNELGKNFVTDKDGYIDLNGVPWGEYALREIKAPNGYVLNDELIPFEVTEEGATIELSFPNDQMEMAVTGNKTAIKVIIGLLIVLIALVVIKNIVLKTEEELD